MSLLDRIAQFFKRSEPEPTTTDEMPRPITPSDLANRMRADTDRRQIVLACRRMYKIDPRAKRVLSTLARDAMRGGFTVRVTGNPKAEEVARSLMTRLALDSQLVKWARHTFRDGDSFLEIGVNAGQEITQVTRKPTLQMHRQSNRADRFDDPTHAFWMADSMWLLPDPPQDAVWFAEWQIIHARWDHDEESRYGSPLFASADGQFKRMEEGEIDIAVRRKTRAGMKYSHKFPPGTPATDVEAYKALNKDALDNPFAAVADFFSTADITAVQGDARLQEIADVLHHVRTWWTASPVPMSLIGYGQDLNRDVLDKQKEQYDEELDPITQWLENEIIKPLIERQWLLAGILPEGLNYEIEWVVKGKLTAATLKDAANALLILKTLGLPQPVIVSILERFLPGVDLESMLLDAASQTSGTGADGAGRVANVADQMGGAVNEN
jgi:hypothetical protein